MPAIPLPRVVHTIGSIAEAAGGPTRSVNQACTAMADSGRYSVALVSGRNLHTESAWLQPDPAKVDLSWVDAKRVLGRFSVYPGFSIKVQQACTDHISIVHDHGIWAFNNRAAAVAASKLNIPYVLSPRGMLAPWALNYRATRKRIAWLLYQRSVLERAALLVATSIEERDDIQRMFPKTPVAVIPNAVHLPAAAVATCDGNRHAPFRLLFLSRIHPVKNLAGLVRAWHRASAHAGARDWVLQIAGPDEIGHLAEVTRLAAALGVSASIEFTGAVAEADKSAVFAQADAVILPSFTENFGVVVVEALAHGLPVIASQGTPWSVLNDCECGWWVAGNVESIAEAIMACFSTAPNQRAAMGQRGRALAANSFSWAGVATQMADAYDWLLGRRNDKPGCIHD
jgi:glycosyltransferase involved in cell wall biosynthesis